MTRTYVDANVLIAATRRDDELNLRARQILADPDRTFIGSIFLQLELLPKPAAFGMTLELQYYNIFFEGCEIWVNPSKSLLDIALEEGQRIGLSAMDALHVAGAHCAGAEELVTAERPEKPIYQTNLVTVISIR